MKSTIRFPNPTRWLVVLVLAMFTTVVGARDQAGLAMPDSYSAQVTESVLRSGGNAVDAAVAAAFALAVTQPEAGNLGGGGFMLIHMDGESSFLDYRETAPGAAGRDMYLDEDGEVRSDSPVTGHLAVGVPGTVAGLWEAHQRFGSLPWSSLVAPAIELARDGFYVHPKLADEVQEEMDRLRGVTNFTDYFSGVREREIFRQPELAATLQRISETGREDFYTGDTARLILEEMARGGGLIAAADLAAYEPVWRTPLTANWRGLQVLSAPPPSSGGIALLQLLQMKEVLEPQFDGHPLNSAQYVHLVAEMEKRVFADRAEYLGDPDFVEVPVQRLTSREYAAARAAQVNPEGISSVAQVPPGLESPQTTHFSVVDFDGNAVSNTYTLNWEFGSGVVVTGAGFLLNDEMDDFSAKPGVPNIYGVVGSTANAIEPGKRMLSSMTPTILLQDGKVVVVVGTPGGSTIFTTVFQVITNLVDFGMSPEQSVAASRFHHQLLPPDQVTYDPNIPLPAETVKALEKRGYQAIPHGWTLGDVMLVSALGGKMEAAADPRKRGVAKVLDRAD